MSKIDEYKIFVESTQFLTERRQNATQVYVTVNTLIFAVLGFLIKDSGVEDASTLLVVSGALVLCGISASVVWLKAIRQYRKLIAWRFQQLMEMESDPQLDCHQMYTKEYRDLFSSSDGSVGSFSDLEAWLPRLFVFVYVAYFFFVALMGL